MVDITEDLTIEQKLLIPKVRDYWLKVFFELKFDEKKAREMITFLYTVCKMPVVESIILDSPLAVQLMANVFAKAKNKAEIITAVKNAFTQNIAPFLADFQKVILIEKNGKLQINFDLSNEAALQFKEQYPLPVLSLLPRTLFPNSYLKLWTRTCKEVGTQYIQKEKFLMDFFGPVLFPFLQENEYVSLVFDQTVMNALHAFLPENEIRYYSFAFEGGLFSFGWTAFYDFFTQIGMIYHPEFNKFKELLHANIFHWCGFDQVALISRPPLKCTVDSTNKLHNIDEPAILFADGFCQRQVYGVIFKKDLFETYFAPIKDGKDGHPLIDPTKILNETNAEIRTTILKAYGPEFIRDNLPNCRVVDTLLQHSRQLNKDVPCRLYTFRYGETDIYFVELIDHTTGKVSVHFVGERDSVFKKVSEAINWMNQEPLDAPLNYVYES